MWAELPQLITLNIPWVIMKKLKEIRVPSSETRDERDDVFFSDSSCTDK